MKRTLLLLIILDFAVVVALIGYFERGQVMRSAARLFEKSGTPSFQVRTQEVSFLSGNVQLKGTLYLPERVWLPSPAVVLCHGGTKLGRKLALYVVMAQQLAARGYAVLTFDFRGFGDSEDPHRFETFADLDFVQDVSSALTFLAGVKQVDAAQFYVIGHSFGAGVAVMAGIRDFRIRKVVSISPGRLTQKLFFGANAADPEYPIVRMSRDMKIDPPIPQELFDPHLKDYIAEAILDYPVHPPTMFVDGAEESQAELLFLRDVYARMSDPKGYVTISAADHYYGTKRDQRGQTSNLPYDKAVLTELLNAIELWFRKVSG